jgi:putative FmdB family regulatory protein
MPTYEYRCPECGANFEKVQRMSDDPVAECPECSAVAQRRLSGGAGLLSKGSGFYITDYRGDGYKKAAQAESKGSDSSGSAGDKPAATDKPAANDKPAKSETKGEPTPSGGSPSKQAD